MRWTVTAGDFVTRAVDLLVVAVHETEQGIELAGWEALDRATAGGLSALQGGTVFAGKPETWALVQGRGCGAPWVLVVGLGPRPELTLERLRRCAGVAAQQARRVRASLCGLALPRDRAGDLSARAVGRSWVEGAERALGTAEDEGGARLGPRQDCAEQERWPAAWLLIERDARRRAAYADGIAEGEAFMAGALLARRLVNLPPDVLTPQGLAKEARALARREGMSCQVLGAARLARLGLNGLIGVARGSGREPQLIVLEGGARPKPAEPRRATTRVAGRRGRWPFIALVGKGLTFDAGGLSLKTPASMETMKNDMAGAAAVLGAAVIVRRLAVPVRLLVVVPAVENVPDGASLRPGEVLTLAGGRTVEVLNTDAEGRLVLADALAFACQSRPDWLIDAATLTSACVMALGREFAGVMATSVPLVEALVQAGGETFERVWQLPLVEEHRAAIKGDLTELKNVGPREGAALTAAAFLGTFVDDAVAWAHIDLAGPVWSDKASVHGPKGATGYGARLLARAVQILVSSAP